MMMRQLLTAATLTLLAVTTFAESVGLPPQVAISPPRVEVAFEGGSAQSAVRLFNMSDRSVEVSVRAADWYLDETNALQIVAPDDDSMTKTLLLNPSKFEVPAGESQAVRFAVRPRSKPRDGEHRMMLFLNEKLPEDSTGNRFVFEFQVPVYVLSGDIQRVGELLGVSATYEDGLLTAGFDVASEGNASVRLEGTYLIRKLDDDVPRLRKVSLVADDSVIEGPLPNLPVIAGTRRVVEQQVAASLSPGAYEIEVHGSLSGEPVTGSTVFRVP